MVGLLVTKPTPYQASLVRRVARNPVGLKTKLVKWQIILAQGQWLSSKSMQQNAGDGVTQKASSPICRANVVSKAKPHYVHTMKLMALIPQQLWSSCPWQQVSNIWNRGCEESLGSARMPQDF